MSDLRSEASVLNQVVGWATAHPLIRALVLESSRAAPQAVLDQFSDYDLLLVVSDPHPFADDTQWLSDFGRPLVTFRDARPVLGTQTYSRLVLYADYTKIDYTIWPVEVLSAFVQRRESPDLLDWGYLVLLDKDGVTAGLTASTRTAHIPAQPTEGEYYTLVEGFWWEAIYVAKNLWRDELIHAKYNLEVVMKFELLLPLLEWRVEIERNWSWKPGIVGRGLKQHLPPDLWFELERTYVGSDLEENWEALFRTTALFRRAASEVGSALGYAYPEALDVSIIAYLEHVRSLPH
jgi:aminoglycoside 6-adenylyltransferase